MIKNFIKKYKELLLYVVFGVCTTAVDWGVSFVLYHTGMNMHAADVVAWIAAVVFAYVTNKIFVFESKDVSPATVAREFVTFASSRVLTLLLQEAIVFVFYDKLALDKYAVKIMASVIVVILNYVFSKLFVFKKNKGENDNG